MKLVFVKYGKAAGKLLAPVYSIAVWQTWTLGQLAHDDDDNDQRPACRRRRGSPCLPSALRSAH